MDSFGRRKSLTVELKALVKQLNLVDKFIFIGTVQSEDVMNYYTGNTIDLFVNTSSSEGVPFSIMEAFAAGIPVMATNVGGTGEIVDDRPERSFFRRMLPRQNWLLN